MKNIPLGGRHGAGKYALVDDDQYDILMTFKWHVTGGYAVSTLYLGGGASNPKNMTLFMHRLVALPPTGYEADHINGDTLDNRRENLRVATRTQNVRNVGIRSDNTSGYKGVSWNKARCKYGASIAMQGRSVHLGLYDTAEQAAIVYNAAAISAFGKFARLNEIPSKADL